MDFLLRRDLFNKGHELILEGGYTGTFDSLSTACMNMATYYLPELGQGSLQDIGEFIRLLDRASFYYQDDFKASPVVNPSGAIAERQGFAIMNKLLDGFKGHWVPARYEVAKELFDKFVAIVLVKPKKPAIR